MQLNAATTVASASATPPVTAAGSQQTPKMDLRKEVGRKGRSGDIGSKGKGPAPYKKQSRRFMSYEEKKENTEREVAREVAKDKSELGEEEYWRRINERIRLHNEAAMESVKEEEERRRRVREEERERARRKLERMERGEDEDDAEDIADNDHLVTPPSPNTLKRGNASFGAATTEFKDVRVKDAQRDAADMRGKQRENGEGGEGEGMIPLKYLQRDEDMDQSECTPYEEDEESEREREREREKEERRSKKEKRSRSRRDSHKHSSSRQADARDSSMEE